MKRLLYTICAFALSVTALSAQTMYDGLKYSDVNLYGTARSIALGNALTAVGGDLGSVVLNPAGSSVAGYSQFSLSQGMSTANVTSDYSAVAGSDDFSSSLKSDKSRYTMPNIGFVINMPTPGSSSIKSYSLGFMVSTTGRSLDRMSAFGTNEFTTMMGDMAYKAYGIDYNNLVGSSAYDNYNWTLPLSYQSFMISELDGTTDEYLGATESDIPLSGIGLCGPVDQKYIMQHTGSRNDMVFNVAANISDRLYLGFNLGMPLLSYKENIFAGEYAVEQNDFQQNLNGKDVYFQSAYQRYYLDTDAEGIYAQIGAICLLGDFVRLGASVKTPTWYSVRERWGYDATTSYDSFSESAQSPDGDYSYNLVTPMELNLGIAATLSDKLLVSLDRSVINHKNMKFHSSEDSFINDEFDAVNSSIATYAAKTRMTRFGVEYKPLPYLALRYGYTSKKYDADKTISNAFGIGFSSNGAFYADFAVRNTKYPYSWYYPYDDYMYDDSGSLIVRSNEIGYSKSLLDCVLTLGWRF